MKRSLTSPMLPYEKGMRIEGLENTEFSETPWVRPAQFLSRIYSDIMNKYRKHVHFRYSAFVSFKGQSAVMSVQSMPRQGSLNKFVFTILIENSDDELLTSWQQTYDWHGGWFTTHLKLLCLLDP